ncbi:hypothetical protein ONS95_011263 [Cadophora gregata]|uniref:uncharacterized protein n=1 Tax=Cadophora gregata TaxID=51156 RepID=UPI0026DB0B0E|nr:uncharacterized protein ONS95_011263 [Cadophora gregata]KAK0119831.1 hypothetical protein ONS95_011263 [Cadophora gregata]KAK0120866.1 hypothetical protein ONS96_011066 [Cadophora gregata f. sp. sojae]
MSTSTSPATFLSDKASALESSHPVAPSEARAAQIPLQTFNLPTFPPEAFTAGLTSLILTSDIKLDEYQPLLDQPFSVPDLPQSITALTLELFSLGYPPGFLTELGKKLMGIKSLTLYSQLLAGTTTYSKDDAVTFFRFQTQLRELHLLDVFGPKGFYAELAGRVSPSLRFLEVNFTYRHSDPQFLSSVPSAEIVDFLKKGAETGGTANTGLLGLTASISAPDITDDEDDREGTEVGILPVEKGQTEGLVDALKDVGKEMVMLDVTMFEVSVEQVKNIISACPKVKILGLTVTVDKGWGEVFEVLGQDGKGAGVEVLELVGVPGKEFAESIKEGETSGLSKDVLDAVVLAGCKSLKSVKVSVLRTRSEMWVLEGEEWNLKA